MSTEEPKKIEQDIKESIKKLDEMERGQMASVTSVDNKPVSAIEFERHEKGQEEVYDLSFRTYAQHDPENWQEYLPDMTQELVRPVEGLSKGELASVVGPKNAEVILKTEADRGTLEGSALHNEHGTTPEIPELSETRKSEIAKMAKDIEWHEIARQSKEHTIDLGDRGEERSRTSSTGHQVPGEDRQGPQAIVKAVAAEVLKEQIRDPKQQEAIMNALNARLDQRAALGKVPSVPMYDKAAPSTRVQPERTGPTVERNAERTH